ncbi:hypothetical protein GE21DRAFT_4643 [Neurospora crassa]|uniref:Uncharacterized protein n=1 Tax=Neurospora crassa (strain ATCC 24698 / 74-OR23-1A / CBS 708.71 / DSM 1257 / FGSC 987) TaxID=367110 RepID=Q7RZN7_NEUCR|nr:hypothetical protein NCU00327 [Neurospora crassa OR74A]EAA28562.1 hypothetical protein NCU00327 [Neurospora crassa OR74A]KHE89565.1 hypothetical protein GE21DRAFT_4643 [Neurospora crassa]|eukprot:XP_957798.1 hypothetical protein NCU00327 [Neurospora crassa OR74A]
MMLNNPGASIATANPRHPRRDSLIQIEEADHQAIFESKNVVACPAPVVLSFQRYSQHRHQSVYDKCYGNEHIEILLHTYLSPSESPTGAPAGLVLPGGNSVNGGRWIWKGGQKPIVESENAPALGSFVSGEEMGQGIEQQQTHRYPSFPSVVDVMNRQVSKIHRVSSQKELHMLSFCIY